jgi:hypothetical protein
MLVLCAGLLATTQARAASPTSGADTEQKPAAPSPPRVDGPYVGITGLGTLGFARLNDVSTPRPFGGYGGAFRVGETVLPWLTIGLKVEGSFSYADHEGTRQRLGQGVLGVEFGFLPVPARPFSIRAGFGIGGGGVREEGIGGRSGFGGAIFSGALRYEFFPFAARHRPQRGGGFALGPEIGWIGATPAAAGRPMVNTVYAGLAMTMYFGS